ncbi:12-oxophytodienoate reductase [Acrasis kona]|uniref:12-oxophytodienoate reductase n=1 Tax=Acrasis kona TaxID=1008807 RepID=A0AAW2ZG03_9EUKA
MSSLTKQERADSKLFKPITLGSVHLDHRIVMAPLTRFRSPNAVPTPLVAEYYSQRTTKGGLIISEATFISTTAGMYPNAPGIYTQEQIDAWKIITDAVHKKGGKIFCQLWQVGRASNSVLLGQKAYSSSAIAISGINNLTGKPQEVPKEMTHQDIKQVTSEYVQAAKNSLLAGFDGVEIHNANGYLLDQFLQDNINQRTDEYGGSIQNRARFTLEVVDAVVAAIGADKVGIRFSPFGFFQDAKDSDPVSHFEYVCEMIEPKQLAYVHILEPRSDLVVSNEDEKMNILKEAAQKRGVTDLLKIQDEISLKPFKRVLKNTPLLSAGSYNLNNPFEPVEKGDVDGVVYGRYFISNPDLVKRIREGIELTKYDRSTFYTSGEVGYTTWPEHSDM